MSKGLIYVWLASQKEKKKRGPLLEEIMAENFQKLMKDTWILKAQWNSSTINKKQSISSNIMAKLLKTKSNEKTLISIRREKDGYLQKSNSKNVSWLLNRHDESQERMHWGDSSHEVLKWCKIANKILYTQWKYTSHCKNNIFQELKNKTVEFLITRCALKEIRRVIQAKEKAFQIKTWKYKKKWSTLGRINMWGNIN